MSRHHIELTAEERKHVAAIDFREILPRHEDGHASYLANREPIMALLKSLSERNGIPKRRVDLWTDPQLAPGRSKGSYKEMFARNGSSGEEAYTHPHFLKFLRYFLFGADLPEAAIKEFEEQVGNPEWFSGSDIIALTKKTREIVRRYGLRGHNYPEEFQKLALDNGLNNYNALSVRSAALEAGRR